MSLWVCRGTSPLHPRSELVTVEAAARRCGCLSSAILRLLLQAVKMAKIKASNLGHSNALRHSGKVKKETPDMKSRRDSGQGVKGKLDKNKLGSVGKKKRKNTKGKSGFSSDSRVKCDWCEESFCRWVYLLSRSWVLCHPCFMFREMVPHILRDHGFHVRINCKVRSKTGVCSWSCGSRLHCYTRH